MQTQSKESQDSMIVQSSPPSEHLKLCFVSQSMPLKSSVFDFKNILPFQWEHVQFL